MLSSIAMQVHICWFLSARGWQPRGLAFDLPNFPEEKKAKKRRPVFCGLVPQTAQGRRGVCAGEADPCDGCGFGRMAWVSLFCVFRVGEISSWIARSAHRMRICTV